IEELNKEKIEAILDRLRQLAQDSTVVLKEVTPGSVRLRIESSRDGFEVIQYLFQGGSFLTVNGLNILDLSFEEMVELVELAKDKVMASDSDRIHETVGKEALSIKGLVRIIESYLGSTGYLQPVALGDDQPKVTVALEDNERLARMLTLQIRSNDKWAVVGMGAICLLGILAIGLATTSRANPIISGGAACATCLAVLLILRWLRRLWSDNTTMKTCLRLLEDQPPDRGAEIINFIYWSYVKRR
ncbi:MAG: hypothetical protein ACREDR_12845, partial [Blastocatellia bacterium]